VTRILLFFLIVFSARETLEAAEKSIFISLEMNDCSSCINNLRFLNVLDSNTKVFFVLAQSYTRDSLELRRKLKLGDQHQFIWSDTLHYSLLFDKMYSSVSYFDNESRKLLKFDLKTDMDADLIRYFNKLGHDVDTFRFSEEVIKPGTRKLVQKGDKLFTLDRTFNTVEAFSMINGARLLGLSLDDSLLIKAAFKAKFRNQTRYAENELLKKGIGIVKDREIATFAVKTDGIGLLASYTFFEILPRSAERIDTFEQNFHVIHEFDLKGKYLSTAYIKPISVDYTSVDYLKNREQYGHNFYGIDGFSLQYVGDEILTSVMHGNLAEGIGNYFAAYFKKDEEGNYVFDRYYSKELPAAYKRYDYNFSSLEFSSNDEVFILPLSTNIYDIRDRTYWPVPRIINGEQFMGNPFSARMFINFGSIQGSNLYLHLTDNAKKEYRYLKIDKETLQVKQEASIGNDGDRSVTYSIIDFLNNNYILMPVSPRHIVRKKIF
jgi:hypothetical protein